jgi:hypothetical protein
MDWGQVVRNGADPEEDRIIAELILAALEDAGLQVTMARSRIALKETREIAFNELRHGINEIASLHRPADSHQDSRNERRLVTCFRRAGRGRN